VKKYMYNLTQGIRIPNFATIPAGKFKIKKNIKERGHENVKRNV